MSKNKKPTLNEVRDAISIIIKRMDGLYQAFQQNNLTFTEYLIFKNDGDKFTEHLQNKYDKGEDDAKGK
jgi:hypothetical protein|tara:strand:+ start:274 stop:480 length:207 start_codon:yes stop_codon:yes gene_type:complete